MRQEATQGGRERDYSSMLQTNLLRHCRKIQLRSMFKLQIGSNLFYMERRR